MKLSWLDIRNLDEARDAIVQEALHQRIEGIVAADQETLEGLPPTVTKVLFPRGKALPEDFGEATVVIVDPDFHHVTPAELAIRHPGLEFGRFV